MAKTVKAQYTGIETLRLDRIMCAVQIIGEDREDVSLSYEGKIPIRILESPNTLLIEMRHLFFVTVRVSTGKLIIRMPNTVINMHLRKMVGTLDLQNIAVDNLQLRSNVGNLICTNVQARSLLVIAKNIGETHVSEIKAETIIMQKNIGNIYMCDSAVRTIKTRANIGDIHLVRTSAQRLLRKGNIGRVGQKSCMIATKDTVKVNS